MVSDFLTSARLTGKAAGLPNLRVAVYPGAIAIHPLDEVEKNIREIVFPQIIKLLTEPVVDAGAAEVASKERSIVFEGSFEEINEYFHAKQWSDGAPIVPPTEEKVAEFLKYTRRAPDEVLGVLHPALRRATVHSIAVNGVMAGCRPEYMPVLIAAVEAIADPRFHLEDAGSSAGWAPLIILNGPAIKRLGFNAGTAALRVGYQANTTVGRFLRLYMRNVAGFMPGVSDMATFGRPNFPVLAENESASPWEPLSVTRGFGPADSVVTVSSVGFQSFTLTVVAQTPEKILHNITMKLQQILLAGDGSIINKGPEESPLLVMSPVIAKSLADAGYTKKYIQQYAFEHSRVPAREFDRWLEFQGHKTACECVTEGMLPSFFCESEDPERPVPLYHSAEELQVIVAGTEQRNRFFVAQQVGRQGLATSKKIDMSLLDSTPTGAGA